VALEVDQVKVVDCPLWIVVGLAVIEAVGAAGGGGGGGGGGAGATFFLHAPNVMIAAKATISAIHFILLLFTLSSKWRARQILCTAPGGASSAPLQAMARLQSLFLCPSVQLTLYAIQTRSTSVTYNTPTLVTLWNSPPFPAT